MKAAYFFHKSTWEFDEVLGLMGLKPDDARHIRVGFNNYAYVVAAPHVTSYPPTVKHYRVIFQHGKDQFERNAIIVDQYGPRFFDADVAFEDKVENLQWDFGLCGDTSGSLSARELGRRLIESYEELELPLPPPPTFAQLLDSDIGEREMRLILDIATLMASKMALMKKIYAKQLLQQYILLFNVVVLTRTAIEKLMLLIALIDPALDYNQIANGKKVRSTFVRQSKNSTFSCTVKLRRMLQQISQFDSVYRTPEIHKAGNLWAKVCEGHFSQTLNEILSHSNDLIAILSELGAEMLAMSKEAAGGKG